MAGKANEQHRMWRTLPGVIGNLVVGLAILVVTVVNITEGQWVYVLIAIAVLVGFGVAPAMAAHRDGELYFTRERRTY